MQQKFQLSFFYIRFSIILIMNVCIAVVADAQYELRIDYLDKDSTFRPQTLKLQTNFSGQTQCEDYINKLSALLNLKGYAAASVDKCGESRGRA